jgi:hypothetical protein
MKSPNAGSVKTGGSLKFDFKKLHTTPDKLRGTLEEYGVAILPILTAEEIAAFRAGIWADLKKLSNGVLSPDDPKTWKPFVVGVAPLHGMLMQHYGTGHLPTIWKIRQTPKIADVFAKLWGCSRDDLLVSFDGLSLHLPPEVTNRGWYRGKNKLHLDTHSSDFDSVQSFLNLYETRAEDATFRGLIGSHKHHGEFFKKFRPAKTEWVKMGGKDGEEPTERMQFYLDRDCIDVRVPIPAGALLMWDSRTVHAGAEPIKDRLVPSKGDFAGTEPIRMVVYLCYTDRKLATAAQMRKKIKAFKDRRNTGHCPHKIKLMAKTPRYSDRTFKVVWPDPADIAEAMNDFGRRLAGLESAFEE